MNERSETLLEKRRWTVDQLGGTFAFGRWDWLVYRWKLSLLGISQVEVKATQMISTSASVMNVEVNGRTTFCTDCVLKYWYTSAS